MLKNIRQADMERMDERLSVISPLLSYVGQNDKESRETLRMKKHDVAMQHGISERTVDRYLKAYQEGQLSGLEGKYQTIRQEKLSKEIIGRAIELKNEVPTRSIETIITILVQEGLAQEGEVKRTTLQDALARRGYSCKELRLRYKSMYSSDRYEASRRNELWVTDIKYGPKIMYEGTETQTYLSAVMDDYSRHIVFARFYTSQGAPVVVDSIRHAVEEYGVPEELYFDNGKMYRSNLVERLCKVLGIQKHHSPPYRAQARGKIERFFGHVNQFMDENEADPAPTLNKLNERLAAWITICHEHHINRTTHQEPEDRYMRDRAKQNFVSKELLDYAVKRVVTRKVDNSGDITFDNHDYHVGVSFAHREVALMYDDSDHSVLYMENPDGNIVEIRARNTGRYTNNPKSPVMKNAENTAHYLDNMVAQASGKETKKRSKTHSDDNEPVPAAVAQTIRYDYDEEVW